MGCRIFFLLFLCFSLIFCTQESEETRDGIILGFSQIGAESAWRNANTLSIQNAATAAGIQLLFANAEQKQENQIQAIRSFIVYRVDVIAFVPIVTDGWENVLREAREANIPVLICDREINVDDETLFAGYIGTNMFEQGRKAAEFLLKKYIDPITGRVQEDGNSPIRIVELRGTEGSSPAIQRALGFREVLGDHPDFEIIYSVSGDFLRSRGFELMQNILEDLEDIDVLFSHNDGMALGAIEAMKRRGIQPGTDIIIVTIDAEQAAIDALRRGEINCVVECNPMQGPEIMNLVRQLSRGLSIPRVTFMHEGVFTQWDNHAAIMPRGY